MSLLSIPIVLLAAVLISCAVEQPADIIRTQLSSLFTDNMVLQRNWSNPIWGKATPHQLIKISIANKTVCTTADDKGRWLAKLPIIPTGGPYELMVTGNNRVVINNVAIGDVWLCAGQSNMGVTFSNCYHLKDDASSVDYKMIRFFQMRPTLECEPTQEVNGNWLVVTPKTLPHLSAIGYYFSKEVYLNLKVPIGIILCSTGGSPLKTWMSRGSLGGTRKRFGLFETSSVFNGMIAPILGCGIKGIIWYQGEADLCDAANYGKLFAAMIEDWRTKWQNQNLPWFYVQLPNCLSSAVLPTESAWAEFREAQANSSRLPNVHMIVTIDTGERQVNLHPKSKAEIGHRLASAALAVTYGCKVPFVSPSYKAMQVLGTRVKISFKDLSGHLVAKGQNIDGFAIAGEDKKFYWANVEIVSQGKEVDIWSEQVPKPVAVRYGWADNPKCNLYTTDNLPVAPFRTDSWKPPERTDMFNALRVSPEVKSLMLYKPVVVPRLSSPGTGFMDGAQNQTLSRKIKS
jgi:sialate O-acetylesterase